MPTKTKAPTKTTATKKTATKAKTTITKTTTSKTAAKKPTKKKAKLTPRETAKNKTASRRTAKKTAIKTAAKKTAKKTAAKVTTTKKTTATKTTAKTTKTPTLTTGTTAPNFTVTTDSGTKMTLTQLRGQNVVLYFYPKDDTPGCTTEACSFRDNLPRFNKLNATVIGVSMDDTTSHKKFKTKYKLPFTLAADTTGEVCQQYGVIGTKSMYGKTYTGIIRSTFLIDTTGTVRAIWRNVSVTGHVETVAETLQTLGTTTKAKSTTKTTAKKKAA